MSWLCDVCGYENEFSDDVQTTTCNCCGEPAPQNKIIQARCELEAYHREEERKARLEELRRKQESRQKRIDTAVRGILKAFKAVSVMPIAAVILAIALLGFSLYNESKSLKQWNETMQKNIQILDILDYPSVVSGNVSEIHMAEKFRMPFVNTGDILAAQLSQYFTGMSENVKKNIGLDKSRYSANIKELGQRNFEGLKNVGNNTDMVRNNITGPATNFSSNWEFFTDNARRNTQFLIGNIKGKVGGEND